MWTFWLALSQGPALAQEPLPPDLAPWAVEHLLKADPGRTRWDCWSSRAKLNWFDLSSLCAPQGSSRKHIGYYAGTDCTHPARDALLAATLAALPRDPATVQGLWDQHRDALFGALSAEDYGRYGTDDTVAALLRTHARLWAFADAADRAELRTEAADALPGSCPLDAYEALRDPSGISGCWLVTFWLRRDAEGNADVVLKILEDVDAHYRPGATEPQAFVQLPETDDADAEAKAKALLAASRSVPDDHVVALRAYDAWLDLRFQELDLHLARGTAPVRTASIACTNKTATTCAQEALKTAGTTAGRVVDRKGAVLVALETQGVVTVSIGTVSGLADGHRTLSLWTEAEVADREVAQVLHHALFPID